MDYKEKMLADANKKAWLPRQADTVYVISLDDLKQILATLPSEAEIAKKWYLEWDKWKEREARNSLTPYPKFFLDRLDKEGE